MTTDTPTRITPKGCRCEDCGFRIRGKLHSEGIHHKTVTDPGNKDARKRRTGQATRRRRGLR